MTELNINIEKFMFSEKASAFFENIDFSLSGGDFNFLIGLSGVGKTTLLKIILGINTGHSETDIQFTYNQNKIKREEAKKTGIIGFISQTPSLVPWENIQSNLELPFKLNKNLIKPSKNKIIEELNYVGLSEAVLIKKPHELSFGMLARVSIVRAFLYNPSFIFLDELFTGIDTINSNLIAKRIKKYVEHTNAVCLSVTHDIDRAITFATNIYLLDEKKKLLSAEKPFDKTSIINHIN